MKQIPREWCGASYRFPGVSAKSTRRRGGIRWEYCLNRDFRDFQDGGTCDESHYYEQEDRDREVVPTEEVERSVCFSI